jgi:hypothetical protein
MTVLDDEARDLFAGPNIAHIATLLPDGKTCFLSAPEPFPGMISTSGAFLATASLMIARSARSMSPPRL